MCTARRTHSILLVSILYSTLLLSQSKSGYVDVQGARLFYTTFGSGEPVVVIHGGPGLDHSYLLPQMNVLAHGHELIYYDQRASGESTGSVDSVSITPARFVDDLETLRKALGLEKMNLLGHSWGGLVAMEYAMRYPQRTKSLVLLNSVGANSDFMAPFVKTRIARTTHDDSVAMASLQSSPGFASANPEIMSRFTRIIFKTYFFDRRLADSLTLTFNQNTASHFFPIFGLMGKFLNRYDISDQLATIPCSTFVVSGDVDPIPPEVGENIAQRIKNSRYLLIDHCGHFPYIERPDVLGRALRSFWDQIPQ